MEDSKRLKLLLLTCDRVCVWGGDGRCQEAEVAVADCCDRVWVGGWGVIEDVKRLKLLLLTVVTGCGGD